MLVEKSLFLVSDKRTRIHFLKVQISICESFGVFITFMTARYCVNIALYLS